MILTSVDFAGAILSHQTHHLARREFEIHLFESLNGSERTRNL